MFCLYLFESMHTVRPWPSHETAVRSIPTLSQRKVNFETRHIPDLVWCGNLWNCGSTFPCDDCLSPTPENRKKHTATNSAIRPCPSYPACFHTLCKPPARYTVVVHHTLSHVQIYNLQLDGCLYFRQQTNLHAGQRWWLSPPPRSRRWRRR